jgi:hypothetical protein
MRHAQYFNRTRRSASREGGTIMERKVDYSPDPDGFPEDAPRPGHVVCGGNGGTVLKEVPADVRHSPKRARERLERREAEADTDLAAANCLSDSASRDLQLARKFLAEKEFEGKVGNLPGVSELCVKEMNRAAKAARKDMLGVCALVGTYAACIGAPLMFAWGHSKGKASRPISSRAAEAAIDWLVSKL